ncbi:MAG TPA: hypothetical protein VGJ26_10915 [Pirellulales bacterium]|jgi:hypothetical protein
MNAPAITLTLHDSRRVYRPGEKLSGQYFIETVDGAETQAAEVSVLWHTEGKGDEDIAVHFFDRVSHDERPGLDFRQPRVFSTVLPNSPLSYEGVLVKIRWCVRLRVFLSRGKQLVEERAFQLGEVPPARAVLP